MGHQGMERDESRSGSQFAGGLRRAARVVTISKAYSLELKKIIDKKLWLKLNSGKHVQGILQEFDPFMNLVIDERVEMTTSGQQNNIRMGVIGGNHITMLEALE
ncbi:small nuclear ribonucleoprotein G-like [Nycticebus coucang]|uniref:small nuclear ribonucleoprotein G-like n=1 Tax=Nycticebus coucang TaxID=9470 RepID=UPI00234D85B5|nr:small nuclear ribonucleoprotein G-like [Nycticebus coucang]